MNMEELEEIFERGKRFLDRLELADAEEVFRDILQRVPIYQDPRTDTIVVGSLFGLGEVHAKHCRNAGIAPLDWTCGMLFALLFYRTTSEICAKIVRHRSSSRRDERANGGTGSRNAGGDRFFPDTLARAKSQANAAESSLLAALRGKVLETTEVSLFVTIPIRRRKAVGLDDSWLEGLWDFCCRSVVEYQGDVTTTTTTGSDGNGSGLSGSGASGLKEDPKPGSLARRRFSLIARNSGVETRVPATSISDDPDRNPGDGLPSLQTECSTGEISSKRRINFDRFQDAIKQFVSDVSQEMRCKYANISGKIGQPGGLLEKRVCSELAMRFTAECDDAQELETIYETLLKEENVVSTPDDMEELLDETAEDFQESDSEEEVYDGRAETLDLYIKPSAVYSWKGESAARGSISICNGLIPYGKGQCHSATLTLASKSDAKRIERNRETGAKRNGITSRNNAPGTSTSCSVNRFPGNPRSLSGGRNGGILTKWIHVEKNDDHLEEVSWPAAAAAAVSCGFQEVSAFTGRKERLSSSIVGGPDAGLRRYINEAKLSQILATAAIKLADALNKDTYRVEAVKLYRYAYGILKVHPLSGGQQETLAKLLADMGSTCCGAGEFESGCQLMKQAAALYEASGEMLRQAQVWYQLGNALLSDKLRQESLLAKVMQMVKDDAKRGDDNSEDDSNEEEEEGDSYCTCIYEAIDCYKRALEILDQSGQGSQDPGLLADVLTNLADCRVMTGNLARAEPGYEAALRLFSDTVGRPLLQKNAHVLAMVGTLSFLAGNFVRSATMFETAHALRQHLLPNADGPSLEAPWTLTVLALSYHFLGHHDRTVTWCIRAFKLYARFFGGRLLSVDPLSRWFVVQNLFVLGFAYSSLRLHRKALHYLNFCRNMLVGVDEDCDPDQSTQVYLALGDVYLAVEDKANADRCYEEARVRLRAVAHGSVTQRVLSEELAVRLEGGEGQVPTRFKGRGRLIHDQAVFVQRDAETSIKDATISILLRLGISGSSEEKDIDLAIGCYDDCVQAYRDLREPAEAARALASLGSLCQIKARLQDAAAPSTRRREFLQKAEKYFRDACDLVDSASPVHVQYGNFLYGEGRYPEALQLLLPFAFCRRPGDLELVYGGIEQMALPGHLHHCIDEDDTLVVEARVLAKFLAVLSYRALALTKDADDSLEELYRSVTAAGDDKPLSYVLLGYALLECRLFPESAAAFRCASRLQPESDAAHFAAWATLLLAAYATLAAGLDRLLQSALAASKNNERGTWTFHEKKAYLRRQILRRSGRIATGSNRDKLENRGTSSVQLNVNNSNPVQSHVNRQDACLRQSPNLSPEVRRHVVIETRCRSPGVNGDESKMKWRSRVYRNLPDTSAANSG